jgi:hypothetical protein
MLQTQARIHLLGPVVLHLEFLHVLDHQGIKTTAPYLPLIVGQGTDTLFAPNLVDGYARTHPLQYVDDLCFDEP